MVSLIFNLFFEFSRGFCVRIRSTYPIFFHFHAYFIALKPGTFWSFFMRISRGKSALNPVHFGELFLLKNNSYLKLQNCKNLLEKYNFDYFTVKF